ncbi:alpha/beta hydrolase [Kineococcus gynurae]|uniref:Alpha/beta hydrolase n=1 Tax=Kineococcus gynurae TaxID=452979 RepID=A0ABV5LNN7_9ACTN
MRPTVRKLRARPTRAVPTVALLSALTLVSACSSAEPPQRLAPSDGFTVDVVPGLTYAETDGQALSADVCLPREATGTRPALLVLHSGGFTSGSRDDDATRALCEWGAREGYVGVAIDYRLAPQHIYPAQVDDVQNAVTWLREPAQVGRFKLDPARIGALGSSAGAVLALTAGARGEGARDEGSRLAAVVSLSGVADLRSSALALGDPSPEAQQLVSTYLGCTDLQNCPAGEEASAITEVDPTDPAMMLVNGTDELVPAEQAEEMDKKLGEVGIAHQLILVPGDRHGVPLMTSDVRVDAAEFLKEHL